ncbi:MAG: hypothetical protein WC873_02745 [Candidatus Gracilibacteria bacterium]
MTPPVPDFEPDRTYESAKQIPGIDAEALSQIIANQFNESNTLKEGLFGGTKLTLEVQVDTNDGIITIITTETRRQILAKPLKTVRKLVIRNNPTETDTHFSAKIRRPDTDDKEISATAREAARPFDQIAGDSYPSSFRRTIFVSAELERLKNSSPNGLIRQFRDRLLKAIDCKIIQV